MRVVTTLLLLTSLLMGCGFRLQNQGGLPEALQRVELNYVGGVVSSEPPLVRALQAEIERRGGRIGTGGTELQLIALSESQQVLSVGADGKALEYLLTTTARFTLNRDGKVIVSPHSLSVSREYSFDNREVLGTEGEANQLREQMQQELADLILLRLESQLDRG